jgi:hypothetical protein
LTRFLIAMPFWATSNVGPRQPERLRDRSPAQAEVAARSKGVAHRGMQLDDLVRCDVPRGRRRAGTPASRRDQATDDVEIDTAAGRRTSSARGHRDGLRHPRREARPDPPAAAGRRRSTRRSQRPRSSAGRARSSGRGRARPSSASIPSPGLGASAAA